MAKQLLGKEVNASLNERIKADVAALKEKGINRLWESFAWERTEAISLMRKEPPNVVRHWAWSA